MLFDTAETVTANCEPCSKDDRKAQEQCCHLMVEVSLAWHNACVRNVYIQLFTKQETWGVAVFWVSFILSYCKLCYMEERHRHKKTSLADLNVELEGKQIYT